LISVPAVGRDPVRGVVFFIHGVADTGVGSRKDTVASDIEGKIHEFVHVLEDYHVAIKLYNTFILDE